MVRWVCEFHAGKSDTQKYIQSLQKTLGDNELLRDCVEFDDDTYILRFVSVIFALK